MTANDETKRLPLKTVKKKMKMKRKRKRSRSLPHDSESDGPKSNAKASRALPSKKRKAKKHQPEEKKYYSESSTFSEDSRPRKVDAQHTKTKKSKAMTSKKRKREKQQPKEQQSDSESSTSSEDSEPREVSSQHTKTKKIKRETSKAVSSKKLKPKNRQPKEQQSDSESSTSSEDSSPRKVCGEYKKAGKKKPDSEDNLPEVESDSASSMAEEKLGHMDLKDELDREVQTKSISSSSESVSEPKGKVKCGSTSGGNRCRSDSSSPESSSSSNEDTSNTKKKPTTKKVDSSSSGEDSSSSENEVELVVSHRSRTKKVTSSKQDKKWQAHFEELVKYKRKHGHCEAPYHFRDNPTLGKWVRTQRNHGKRYPNSGPMTRERYEALDEIGFVWTFTKSKTPKVAKRAASSSSEDDSSSGDEEQPNVKAARKESQKRRTQKRRTAASSSEDDSSSEDEEHPNAKRTRKGSRKTRIAVSSSEDDSSSDEEQSKVKGDQNGSKKARTTGSKKQPTAQNAVKVKKNAKHDKKWQQRFKELMEFKLEHGHCKVPQSKNPALGKWVTYQRQEGRKYPNSGRMTEERYKALDDLGFTWTVRAIPKKVEQQWEEHFKELVAFKEKNGHCQVPQGKEYATLGNWVMNQRRQGCAYPQSGSMTASRYKALDDLGFVWNPRTPPKKKSWEEYFEELVAFKEKNGHCVVPQANPTLGRWVDRQRQQGKAYPKSGPMTAERHRALDDLGFVWSGHTKRTWEDFFKELVGFKKKYRHCQVPLKSKDHGALSRWVLKQRRDWKEYPESGPLTEERYKALNDLGFIWEPRTPATKEDIERTGIVHGQGIRIMADSVYEL